MTTTVDAPAQGEPQFLDAVERLELLEAGSGKAKRREVRGRALPYGEELARPHWSGARRQMFAPGSAKVRDNATLFYGHDHLTRGTPIGRTELLEDADDGVKLRGLFWNTPKADEVYALATPDEDGKAVLDRFSVGFWEVAGHLEDDGDLYVHDEVDVFENSLTHDPAFTGAQVAQVLNRINPTRKETPMSDTLELTPELLARLEGAASADDVQTLSTSINDLERRIATLGGGDAGDDAPTVPYDSYGEFLQGVATREAQALEFLAYVGSTTVDLGDYMKDSWVGERFKQIEARRRVMNFFSSSPLPATGLGVEYGIVGTDTTQVGKQAAEGDVLPYGKITFDTDRAPLETYGGWGELTYQEIQRSPVNVVERFFGALVNRYAKVTEAAVQAELLAAGTALTGGVTDLSTSDGWTVFVIRAARALEDAGYPIEGVFVGWDVFEDLALLRDGDATDAPRLLNRGTGRINVTGLSGDVFDLPVLPIDTGATANVVKAANSEAIRSYEAAGAPFRLQDDDITNLTKAGSIYGYMAKALEVPGAIVTPQTV